MTMHLDSATWAALQKDPKANAALIEHLAGGCDTCDEFIASRPELDGSVDRLLLALAPRAEAPLDEVGFMRLRRALRQPRRFAMAAIAAALFVTVVGAWLASRPKPIDDGTKGPSQPQIELAAAVRTPSGFSRVDEGAEVRASSVLVLRARSTIDGPARVYLERLGSGELVEIAQVGLRAGLHDVENEQGLLGVTLEGEQGPLAVWVVAGESPVSPESAVAAIRSNGSPGLAVARVQVRVIP